MQKPKYNTKNEKAAEDLDLSYVELQEHTLLESQNQDFLGAFRQEDI